MSDLEPGTPPDEAAALRRLGDRLAAERPVPSAAFRSRVRQRLTGGGATEPGEMPSARIAGFALPGLALLAIAAAGLAGVGPFAA